MEKKRVFTHIPYHVLVERLDDIAGRGINPEVYIDGGYLDGFDRKSLERVRAALDSRGLALTIHGPYMGLNPGSPDETKRLHTAERYRKAFAAASILKPVNMVLHAGYDEKVFKGDVRRWIDCSLRTWPEFVREAEMTGVTIAAENIFDKDPYALKELVSRVSSENFRVCIDAGHLNIFSRVPTEDWFRELGSNIAEVHLHDNCGRSDDHLPLGEGTIDFASFFMLMEKYGVDPVYTIEPHGEETLKRALEAVNRFL